MKARWALLLVLLPLTLGLRVPWWKVTGVVLKCVDRFNSFSNVVAIDFSAGAGALSTPELVTYGRDGTRMHANGTAVEKHREKPQLLLAHQMGRKLVARTPDPGLLGLLVLILAELLRRQVERDFVQLPPALRDYVRATSQELDDKLEYLSSMQWKVEPFLRAELENLQKQPLEVVDRFIVTEILPRVDTTLSPVLSSLVGDPMAVKEITERVKGLIQLGAEQYLEARRESRELLPDLSPSTSGLTASVDTVGSYAEQAISRWNTFIAQFGEATKQDKVIDVTSTRQMLQRWNLLVDTANLGLSNVTFRKYTGPSNALAPRLLPLQQQEQEQEDNKVEERPWWTTWDAFKMVGP